MSICIEQKQFKSNNASQSLFINKKSQAKKTITFAKFSIFKTNYLRRVKSWPAISRQRKALRKLDERLLADIGCSIEQAREEYSKPFWK